ncbi:MAG TPA: hypothetical protein VFI42_10420, partial [Thermomicrobiaceae bacterium]|nr:hypothetical protein [Thermomicrobiaceae bacterium]
MGDNASALVRLRESLKLFTEEQDPMQVALTLIDITVPLARNGNTRQAVRLLAAAESCLEEMALTLAHSQQAIHQEVTTAARG